MFLACITHTAASERQRVISIPAFCCYVAVTLLYICTKSFVRISNNRGFTYRL